MKDITVKLFYVFEITLFKVLFPKIFGLLFISILLLFLIVLIHESYILGTTAGMSRNMRACQLRIGWAHYIHIVSAIEKLPALGQ